MLAKPLNLLSELTTVMHSIAKSTSRNLTYIAIGTSIAVMSTLPNAATAAVTPNLAARGTVMELSLIARAIRRPFQGAPAPAWRRRCEMNRIVVGHRRVRALTNPRTQRVPTQSGFAIVRSNGLTTQTVPITRRVRVCRTR